MITQRTRLAVFAGLLLALAAPAANAQTTRSTTSAWRLALRLPAASQTALDGRDGLTWDQMRRNGLDLTARGSGEVSLVMFVLAVRDGRVVDKWQSSAFPAASGTAHISGRYLPGWRTIVRSPHVFDTDGGSDRITRIVAPRAVDVDVLVKGVDLRSSLPADLVRGRLLVMFAAPLGGGSGSSTGPLFVRTDLVTE